VIYVFEDIKTGETVELDYPFGQAPKIGEIVESMRVTEDWPELTNEEICELPVQTVRRIASFSLDSGGIARKTWGYPFVSHALPKGCCPDSCTADGKPIVKSQRHERDILARTGYIRGDPGRHTSAIRDYEKESVAQRKAREDGRQARNRDRLAREKSKKRP